MILIEHALDECINGHDAKVLATAGADADRIGLHFLVAYNHDIRDFLQAQLAEFLVDFFAAQILLNANACGVHFGNKLLGKRNLRVSN